MKTIAKLFFVAFLLGFSASAFADAHEQVPETTDPLVPEEPAAVATTTAMPADDGGAFDKTSSSLGVGAGTTIAGQTGLMLNRFFSPSVGFQGTISLDFDSLDGDMDTSASRTQLGFAGYLVWQWMSHGNFNFNLLGGLEYLMNRLSAEAGGMDNSQTGHNIALGGGMQAELFILPQLSIFVQTGASLAILGKNNLLQGQASDSGYSFRVGPSGRVINLFGFTWWM